MTTALRADPPIAVDLPVEARDRLLALARAALAAVTGAGSTTRLDGVLAAAADLDRPAAVFVTLTEEGDLRGCIGTVRPDRPLSEAVLSAATSAAGRDPRFPAVRAAELDRIEIEISILGTPVPLEDMAAFRPGVDGVIVEREGRLAILLPEVATTLGWGTVEMLNAVCVKAGLQRDAWRRAGTRLRRFRTTRFGGPALEAGGGVVTTGS